ncbi:hypothetical protein [Planctomycetes bacterium K23_9]|uniref:Chromosome partition protein Smc n=1 Tax=Stieleria marina TaxID=1930275 RepID=A0A517NUU8_9BACT|nr:Chromosome partition protein Smc [Planctomycetes bacterium K23_9]
MPDTSQNSKPSQSFDDLKDELDEVYRANERTADLYDQAVAERNKLAEDCESLQEKLECLEAEVETASHQREQELQQTTSRLEAEKSQLQTQLGQQQSDNAKLSVELSTATTQVSDADSCTASLKTELGQVESQLEHQIQESDRLKSELTSHGNELEEALKREQQVSGEKRALAKQRDELASILDAANTQKQAAQQAADLASDKAVSLSSQNLSLQQSTSKLEKEISRLADELIQRDAEIASVRDAHHNLNRSHCKLQADHDQVASEAATRLQQWEIARGQVDALSQEKSSLELRLQSAADLASQQTKQIAFIQGKLGDRDAELADLRSQLSHSQSELEQVRVDQKLSAGSAERLMQTLQAKIRRLQSDLLANAKAVEQHTVQRDLLESELSVSVKKLQQTEALLSNFVAELERVGRERREQDALILQVRSEAAEQQVQSAQHVDQLEQQLITLRQSLAESQSNLEHERSLYAKHLAESSSDAADVTQETETSEDIDQARTPSDEQLEIEPCNDDRTTPPESVHVTQEPEVAPEPVQVAEPTRTDDDLTVIKGIGRKIKELLSANGIDSFRCLASIDSAKLEQILKDAGMSRKRHDPATWAEQAVLAADGKMERLKELQRNRAKSWVTRCVRPVH